LLVVLALLAPALIGPIGQAGELLPPGSATHLAYGDSRQMSLRIDEAGCQHDSALAGTNSQQASLWEAAWSGHKHGIVGGLLALVVISLLGAKLLARNRKLAERKTELEATTRNLTRLTAIQALLAAATSRLNESRIEQRDDAITDILQDMGRFLEVDRAYVFLYADDAHPAGRLYEWRAPGSETWEGAQRLIAETVSPWWQQQLSQYGAIVVASPEQLPDAAQAEREAMQQLGICSLIRVALGDSGPSGVLGFDSIHCTHGWRPGDSAPLTSLAMTLSDAFSRWDVEAVLIKGRNFLDTLFESIPTPLFYKDSNGIYRGVNRSFEQFFGTDRDDIIGRTVYEISPPELAACYDAKDREIFDQGGTQSYASQVHDARGELHDVVFSKSAYQDDLGRITGLVGAIVDTTAERRQQRLLDLRARRDEVLLSLPIAAEHRDEVSFLQHGLETVEQLSDSQIAFLHLVNPDQETLELVAWSKQTLAEQCRAVVDSHYPVVSAGVWADALRRREPVVFNDYRAHSNKRGLPPGHADLQRLISVPVVENGKVVMLTGVGNKPTDYDANDVETVRLVSSELWRLLQHRRAQDSLELAASVFSHARDGILVIDRDGQIVEVNTAFTDITGYAYDEAVGRNPRFLRSSRHSVAFYSRIWRTVLEGGYWRGEVWSRRRDGEVTPQMVTVSSVRNAEGGLKHVVVLFSDISAQKAYESQLEHVAHYDALTGLPNRILLADRIRHALAQTRRRAELLAVAYLDLDGFKEVNDSHGHHIGDQLLGMLASRMRQVLREADTIARLGGDEFVIVLTGLASNEAVGPELNRLLQAVARPLAIGELQLQVSASVGVTFYPQPGDVDPDQLLRQADQAMYQAKLAGRNRYQLFDVETERFHKGQGKMLARMQQGLRAQEFIFYFQPKVNMRTGEVIGAEALVRWDHPDDGVLAPGRFLHHAAGRQLMVDLGELAICTALEQLERWHARGLQLGVSVNIDAHQLQQPGFVPWLRDCMAGHGSLAPGSLVLEVLETSALEDLPLVSRIIAECDEFGVQFSLDDFGTGYSSLSYLKNLPATELKIDQTFVRDCLDDPDDLAILEGIVGLATAFQRRVVAEGVESLAHGEMLLSLGCELAQGYAIARPMPIDAFDAWLGDWQRADAWGEMRPIDRKDLPVLFAGVEHRAWIRRIERALHEDVKAPPLDVDGCRFGHWLVHDGHRRYSDHADFADIAPLHADIHAAGKRVMEAHAEGREVDTRDELAELHRLRDALLERLHRLVKVASSS
jgi:diguanylate cyclase (GGDEF)-like protein/PAS domain S-box-containing protein